MRKLSNDPEWTAWLRECLARAERARQYIGDDRAWRAMTGEYVHYGDAEGMASLMRSGTVPGVGREGI